VTGPVVLALPFLVTAAGCLPCEPTGDPDALTVSLRARTELRDGTYEIAIAAEGRTLHGAVRVSLGGLDCVDDCNLVADAAGGEGALDGYLVLDEVATPLRFRADLEAARAPDELRVAVRRGDTVLVDATTEPDYFDQERCGPRAANVPVYFDDGLD
jgi:hypothetical protein